MLEFFCGAFVGCSTLVAVSWVIYKTHEMTKIKYQTKYKVKTKSDEGEQSGSS